MQKYMMGLKDRQEVRAAIADIVIETYAMDSCLVRAQKTLAAQGEEGAKLSIAMSQIYISYSMDKIAGWGKKVIADVAEGDMLRTYMTILRRLTKVELANVISLQEQVASRIIEAGKYVTN